MISISIFIYCVSYSCTLGVTGEGMWSWGSTSPFEYWLHHENGQYQGTQHFKSVCKYKYYIQNRILICGLQNFSIIQSENSKYSETENFREKFKVLRDRKFLWKIQSTQIPEIFVKIQSTQRPKIFETNSKYSETGNFR